MNFKRLAVKLVCVSVHQKFAVNFDAAQRFLKIMARRKGELLKILVGAPKLVFDAFLFVNVGTRAEPFHDFSGCVADRHARAQRTTASDFRAWSKSRYSML